MNNEFFTGEMATDDKGNITFKGAYDLAGELAHQIAKHKESLWKHFCKAYVSRFYPIWGANLSLQTSEKCSIERSRMKLRNGRSCKE